MAVAGSLTYDTKIDKNGFKNGLNSLENSVNSTGTKIKNIVAALGIDKIISTAFGILNNSIDGAISRLDTLNNYPKVMSNLGISSEEAQKSIAKMSDKLSGLPTTLDEGALAVQRFTSKNNDVAKSTDYFLALNNAILAGGAGTEIQSSALEQLSQSYAKGSMDMMEWRTLQMAMPAQLNQVAKAMEMTTEAVGAGLRGADKDVAYVRDVTMEEFMDAIVRLNQEGVDGFASFEEQARNSTGGIATSITVAKTQVVKGVADIINSLDQFLKDEGLGGIGEIISNIGKKSKEVLDYVAQKLPETIRFLKDIAPVVMAVTTAFVVFKSALAIKKIIKSVRKSFALLNATLAANPILLVVSLIAGLVVAFIYLWNNSESFRNFWIGLWDNIKKAVSTAVNFIVQWFNKIVDFVKNNWQGILLFIANPFVGGFKLLYDNCEVFRNFINNFIESIKNFFVNGWNNIVSFFTETIPQWIQNVINWFSQLPYMIGYHIGQTLGNIIQFGINLWSWVTGDLPQIIQSIIDWFASLPSKIQEWLNNTINNIKDWCVNVYNVTSNWMSRTIETVVSWFRQLPGRIWTWLMDVISKVKNWGTDLVNKAREAAQNMFDTIADIIKGLPDKMMEIGRNIVEGLWNGVKNAKDWMKQKVGEFAKGILDGMKDSLGIHSPSTKARDLVGKFIPQGVAVGVEANTDSALRAIDNMNDDIMSEMNKAVAFETGAVNAKASVKSNNSMLNVIQAAFNIDGSIDIDGQRAGRILTPYMSKILRTGGAY
jgi:tape measure domain-containing protein|nr:MAG TPA: tail tape measure protein [Caudoviricetes sp.]